MANNNDNNLECSLNETYYDEDLLEGSEMSLENSDAIILEKANHLIILILKALAYMKKTRSQQANNSENEGSDKENNTLPNIILRNLRKVATRGQPKLSSYYKKSMFSK
ncbi:19738_t:CDS:2 [Gigaspora margarita]|uniref:19738_t:CDS:1 n=1 Tax=Gigaspora margarita TaxID=4874 RepID=A0ABN7UHE0_GIGMA|nr:19738_t:CDS:2 [Gigaspora margarita]